MRRNKRTEGITVVGSVLEGKRVALVHDWLTGMRGGEKCLEVFCELFPNADLFTLFHEKGSVSSCIESMPIRTSFLQGLPRALRRRYRYFLPFFPAAVEGFDLDGYDLVLSSSHCVAKGVRRGGHTFHISYVYTPMRYMWDAFDLYFRGRDASAAVRFGAGRVRPFLQAWDRKTARRVDVFLCISLHIQERIRRHYGRQARVVYPPVDVSRFTPGREKENYYFMVGALVPNKRVDLAVRAFSARGLPLKIAGEGWDQKRSSSGAGANVEFLGRVDDARLAELYRKARAFVFPGVDDFGITPLEAQACGTPVIAYARGGALETVTGKTGIFFSEPSTSSLLAAVEQMEERWSSFSPEDLVSNAARFSRERFKQEMAEAVANGYAEWLEKKRSGR